MQEFHMLQDNRPVILLVKIIFFRHDEIHVNLNTLKVVYGNDDISSYEVST